MTRWITTAALAAAVAFASAPQAQAQDLVDETGFVDENADGIPDGFRGRHHRRHIARLAGQLTDEQLAELQNKIAELREADAGREEIKAAVDELLSDFGVEVPNRGNQLAERFGDQLTEEQLAELLGEVETLRESGATRDEVRNAVHSLLDGYGVEVPEFGDHLLERFSGVLTDEQVAALSEELDALQESGATRDEIRAAMGESLQEFGIDAPAGPGRGGPRGMPGRFDRRGGRHGRFGPVGPTPEPEPVADPE